MSVPASLYRVCDFVTHDFHCNFVLCRAVSLRSNAPREQFFRMQPNAWLTSLESNDDGQGHSLTYRPTDQWMEDAYRQNLRRFNSHNSFANLTLRNKTWNLLLQPIPGILNGTASWTPSQLSVSTAKKWVFCECSAFDAERARALFSTNRRRIKCNGLWAGFVSLSCVNCINHSLATNLRSDEFSPLSLSP